MTIKFVVVAYLCDDVCNKLKREEFVCEHVRMMKLA